MREGGHIRISILGALCGLLTGLVAVPGLGHSHEDIGPENASLRVSVDGQTFAGAGAAYWVARKGVHDDQAAISWKGHVWRGQRDVVLVARTILNREVGGWHVDDENVSHEGRPLEGGGYAWAYALAAAHGSSVTSTYRSPAENAAVGGAPQSSHMVWGCAADFVGGDRGSLDADARARGWTVLSYGDPGHGDHSHVDVCRVY